MGDYNNIRMIQKAIKVGSSVAVTIPKKALKELGIKAGDSVSVSINIATKQVVMEPYAAVVDHETVVWARQFIKKYRPALEALARQ